MSSLPLFMLAHAIHSGVEFHVMWDITGMAVRWNLKRTYIPEPNIAWRRVYINRKIFKRSSSEVSSGVFTIAEVPLVLRVGP